MRGGDISKAASRPAAEARGWAGVNPSPLITAPPLLLQTLRGEAFAETCPLAVSLVPLKVISKIFCDNTVIWVCPTRLTGNKPLSLVSARLSDKRPAC